MKVEEKLFVNRKPDAVFAFIADLQNEPRWRRNTVEVHAEGPLWLGSVGRTDFKFIGRSVEVDWCVIELEEDAVLCVEYRSDVRGGYDRYVLEPFGLYATTLTVELDISVAGFFGLMTPALRPALGRGLASDLHRLKRILEAW